MDFTEQINLLKTTIRNSNSIRGQTPKVKFISAHKWRTLMNNTLNKLQSNAVFDKNLIEDLRLIVQNIPDQKFVETILNIQPFKPKFQISKIRKDQASRRSIIEEEQKIKNQSKTKLLKDKSINGRQSIAKFKQSVCEKINESLTEGEFIKKQKYQKSVLEEIISVVTNEETLVKEFQSKSHPFKKIFDGFIYIFEHKFKNIVEKMSSSKEQTFSMSKIEELIICDLSLLQEFIMKAAYPYLDIIKTDNPEEKATCKQKMLSFIRMYVQRHPKINQSTRKILRHATKFSPIIQRLIKALPDFAEIQKFQLSEVFRIDGCYVQAMTCLMQFSETYSSKQSLQKLIQFRQSIASDVDDHYKNLAMNPKREMDSISQLSIIKFILVKVKDWMSVIYAQLCYLEIAFGEDDMAYKYDDASYMHTQIVNALMALCIDFLGQDYPSL